MKINCQQVFSVSALIAIFSLISLAQEKLNCDSYRYYSKEQISRAKFRGGLDDKYLTRFTQECSESQYFKQANDLLIVALEERAESSLAIAKFYLKKAEEGNGVIKGAYLRLKEITEKYSRYSKLDEVLFLLVKVNLFLQKDKLEEAKMFYKRLLDEFPFSNYVCEANKLFNSGQIK